MVLALLAAFGGFLGVPHLLGGHFIHNFLDTILTGIVPESIGHGSEGQELALMVISVAVACSGLYLANVLYLKKNIKEPKGPISNFLYHSYYLNEFYDAAIVFPILRFSKFLWKIVDVVIIDGAVLFTAKFSRFAADSIRTIQTGRLEHYLVAMFAGMVLIMGIILAVSV